MTDWLPISRDPDPVRRRQRLRNVHRDAELHRTRQPCPSCRRRARIAGGTGCVCPPIPSDTLAARCLDLADGGCHCAWWTRPDAFPIGATA